jgi:hypothetical protein
LPDALNNRADALYTLAFRQKAQDLSPGIIRCEQRDANGVHFRSLNLRMGKSHKDYDIEFELMDPSGYYLHNWFDKNAKQIPGRMAGLGLARIKRR